jgi:uncharacterized RDD family membrane protein YckC
MQIYVLLGTEQKGPLTVDEIIEMLSTGKINGSTLVWFEGLGEWSPVEKFSDFFPKAIQPNSKQGAFNKVTELPKSNQPKWKKVVFGLHHPWRRYFARFVDLNILGLWGFYFFSPLINSISPDLFNQITFIIKDRIFDGVLLLLFWMPFEVVSISLFGTTPGKWIFGITIHDVDGNKITLLNSARRFIGMAVSGMACGVAIIVFIANLWACKRLEQEGGSSWDRAANSKVVHESNLTWRYGLGIFAVLLAFFSITLLRL